MMKAIPSAVKMTRLSCHRFRSNEVGLWLSVIAYNLGNLWRRLALPRRVDGWFLTSLQQPLAKTGGRLVKHARYQSQTRLRSRLLRSPSAPPEIVPSRRSPLGVADGEI